ncbi:MAG: NifB/NifX family molybdenum-iron cluster-binding protein [Nanoarchaeota archaeon]
MKIAISSEGKDLNSEISSKAGRAPYWLIFQNKELIETIKNPFAFGGGGAGWSVAHMLGNKKVSLVISEKIGENMKTALKQKGIEFKEKSGNINEFLKNLN